MAAGAATLRNPPMVHSISTSPTSRLPPNAATMTSGRVVLSIVKFPRSGSEAGADAGRQHLEEDRCPIMEPQRQRAEQNGGAEACTSHDHQLRRPARRADCGDYLVRRRNWLSHTRPSDERTAAKRRRRRSPARHIQIELVGLPGKRGRGRSDHVLLTRIAVRGYGPRGGGRLGLEIAGFVHARRLLGAEKDH